MIIVGMKAPHFEELQEYIGKTLILFFYPLDFGVIAPCELLQIEKQSEELQRMDCSVIAVSQCSALSHDQFKAEEPAKGGVKGINFPLLADTNGDIAQQYGVKTEAGYNYRGYFVIDKEGIVRAKVIGDLPMGIGATDLVRKVKKIRAVIEEENMQF